MAPGTERLFGTEQFSFRRWHRAVFGMKTWILNNGLIDVSVQEPPTAWCITFVCGEPWVGNRHLMWELLFWSAMGCDL
jgi:hypothetical protein